MTSILWSEQPRMVNEREKSGETNDGNGEHLKHHMVAYSHRIFSYLVGGTLAHTHTSVSVFSVGFLISMLA